MISPQPSDSKPQTAVAIRRTGFIFLMATVALLFGTLGFAFLMLPQKVAVPFRVPLIFYLNTLLLIGSSVVLHLGYTRRVYMGTKWLTPAILIGVLFVLLQAYGWYELYAQGLYFAGSGNKISLLYLLTIVHALHLVGGLGFLLFVRLRYFANGRNYYELALYFWHFLGILWVYLLAILSLGRI